MPDVIQPLADEVERLTARLKACEAALASAERLAEEIERPRFGFRLPVGIKDAVADFRRGKAAAEAKREGRHA